MIRAVLHFLLWTMNEKESHENETEETGNGERQPQTEQQQQELQHLQQQQQLQQPLQQLQAQHQHQQLEQEERTALLEDGRLQEDTQLQEVLPIHNSSDVGPEGPKEPGGPIRKPGFRSKSGIGPPPRPFKKARYAWEIKNYEHTLNNMTQNLGECSTDLQDDSQDSHSSDVNSEGSQEDGVIDPREALPTVGLDRATFLDPRARQLPGPLTPIMPAPYPTTYGMMAAPPPPDASLRPGDCLKDNQRVPPDPDAGILRWHTRQLCRSIFDNTVNRMLENMGFSPVTERSQGIHPLLVLSLSDDDEREAEEAQQRALENEALTAAMHQKGLFLPPYHYDPLESGTTTDYDSSDDDSDLGEDPGPDDLPNETHLQMSHMISRPLPRVPAMSAMTTMTGMPATPIIPTAQMAPPSTQPSSPHPIPPHRPQEPDCDLDKHACDAAVPRKDKSSGEEEAVIDNNKNSVGDHSSCPEVDSESRGDAVRRQADTPSKAENENNNDKYFVDQAIEMAIKQQGLGYQQA
ncbi:uncharacterized protein LOC125031805 isoform X2 [Penaeus chinensis]|uniref:uncharacterized protein LOC125031805 isoform X2 n=1 Tax=Penaeus chinensis TaxID=139456 RepID=UPI001FB668AA|nr:uncharacterized protein LOC125031805 isoform X2 [Penaeus chinensis]